MSAPYNVISQLPQHIVDSYPQFADFLTQYYAFLNENGNPENILSNILKYGDVDTTIDSFKEHILDELMRDIPDRILADRVLLAKHIKELYTKTGTEDSYRLLFRILFDKEIDIYYPGEQVIKTSNDVWKQDISFICHVSDTVPVDTVKQAISNKIIVSLGNKNLPVYVYDVIQLSNPQSGFNLYEFFIRKDFDDDFNTATTFSIKRLSSINIVNGGSKYKNTDTLVINSVDGGGAEASFTTNTNGVISSINLFNNGAGYIELPIISIDSQTGSGVYLSPILSTLYSGTILNSVSKIQVLDTANNYNIGSAYDIPDSTGENLTVQVQELNSDNTVKNFTILSFGQYYPNKFYKTINNNQFVATMSCGVNPTTGAINSVVVNDWGRYYTTAPTVKIIGDGKGAEVTVSILSGNVVNPIIVNAGYGYTVPPAFVLDDSSIAIQGGNSKLRYYKGFYEKTVGTLSSDMAIYDGSYYQTFSYELVVSELFDTYKSVLKKLVHPASYAVWADCMLQRVSQIRVNTYKIDPERSSVISDVISLGDNSIVFDVSKMLSDSLTPVESFSVDFVMSPLPMEYATPNDTNGVILSVGKNPDMEIQPIADSVPLFNVGKNPDMETQNIVETFSVDFVLNSIPSETQTIVDNNTFSIGFNLNSIPNENQPIADSVPVFNVGKNPSMETQTIAETTFSVDFIKNSIPSETQTITESTFTPTLTVYTADEIQRGYFWGGGSFDGIFGGDEKVNGIKFTTETEFSLADYAGHYAFYNSTGVGDAARGYSVGGDTGGINSGDMRSIRYGSEEIAVYASVLYIGRLAAQGVSSDTKGYICGGDDYNIILNSIENIDFYTQTASINANTLVGRRGYGGELESSTDGYLMCGLNGSYVMQSSVFKFSFSTETSTSLGSIATPAMAYCKGGVNSTLVGYIGGGINTSSDYMARVDKLTYSTDTMTLYMATLSTAVSDYATVSSSTKGYFSGGEPLVYETQAITFSTEATSIVIASLTRGTSGNCGVNTK